MIANLPEDEELIIKLFNGIRVEAEVVPSKEKYVPYAGKDYQVSEYVKFKIKPSRYLKEKINNIRDLINYEFNRKEEETDNGQKENDSDRSFEYSETSGQKD